MIEIVQIAKFFNLKLDDWINIITGVGTFISTIIAVYTLREIKKQRESSYIPDLILDSYFVYFYFTSLKEFFNYKIGPFNERNFKRDAAEPYFLIEYRLLNLGHGVAKYIKCQWEFDYETALSELRKYFPPSYSWSEKMDVAKNEAEDHWIFFKHASLKDDISILDYILPENSTPNRKSLTIPDTISKIYTYYLVFKHNIQNPDYEEFYYEDFEKLPNVILNISYQDVLNKTYYKKFELVINFSSLKGHPSQKKNEIGGFYFAITEK